MIVGLTWQILAQNSLVAILYLLGKLAVWQYYVSHKNHVLISQSPLKKLYLGVAELLFDFQSGCIWIWNRICISSTPDSADRLVRQSLLRWYEGNTTFIKWMTVWIRVNRAHPKKVLFTHVLRGTRPIQTIPFFFIVYSCIMDVWTCQYSFISINSCLLLHLLFQTHAYAIL